MFLHAFDMHTLCDAMNVTEGTDAEPKADSDPMCIKPVNDATIHCGTDRSGHYTSNIDRGIALVAYNATTARMCKVAGTHGISDTGA